MNREREQERIEHIIRKRQEIEAERKTNEQYETIFIIMLKSTHTVYSNSRHWCLVNSPTGDESLFADIILCRKKTLHGWESNWGFQFKSLAR